jgi:multidrug efflux pump subunit AcrB
LEVKIDWNEAITVEENNRRVDEMTRKVVNNPKDNLLVSAFVGQQQFLLNRELQQNFNETLLSIKVASNLEFEKKQKLIKGYLSQYYPGSIVTFGAAKNVFEVLFSTSEAPLQARVVNANSMDVPNADQISQLNLQLKNNGFPSEMPAMQSRYYVQILSDRLLYYDVDYERVVQVLKTIFNQNEMGSLKGEQKYIPILLGNRSRPLVDLVQQTTVLSNKGQNLPLRELINISNQDDYKSFNLDKSSAFIPFDFNINNQEVKNAQNVIQKVVDKNPNLKVSFTGAYYKNLGFVKELGLIILVAIALLYFILSAQFESLVQPFIVMLTIAFGLTGAMALLYLAGNSINIMSAIGMIVLIGILDNDSILKIDTMNRSKDTMSLVDAIKLSGKRRLKSQLMTFLTTILGLLPVLFSLGLGAELQRPLALSVIGGMFLGLFISISFIPLVYWVLYRKAWK